MFKDIIFSQIALDFLHNSNVEGREGIQGTVMFTLSTFDSLSAGSVNVLAMTIWS